MKSMNALMDRLHNPDLGKLFIRVALGIVFMHAGWLKLSAMDMVVAGFGSMGIPAFLAYVVAYAEFIGGFVLIIGLFVRYAAVVLSIIMIVAAIKVHLVNGFGLQNGGYEYVLVLLLGALSLITLGGGKYSLMGVLKK